MQMDVSNIVQLTVPQSPALERRDHVQGPDKDVEFLSLRLVNKRGRVRLSPAGIDYSGLPGKLSLLAVGNKKGWFATAIRKEDNSYHVLVSTLSELRTAFESGKPEPEPFISFTERGSSFSVPGTPIILKFADNDERLLIGFLEGPILVYAANDLAALNQGGQPNPIFSFPGDASTIPRDILPNPGDSPELVALMRGVHGHEPGHQIDILDVRELKIVAGWRKGSNADAAPVSMSWSPKGKQIAIGLQSGDMLLYSPFSPGSPKTHLFKPRATPNDGSSLLSTTWLLNPTFYTVYSTPEASSTLFDASASDSPKQTHFISTHDSKSKSALDIELRDPCPPFGARRPPGSLLVVLRNWNPTKFIIFCGGGSSSDIGVIGTLPSEDPSKPGDQWSNFNLEETSTPTLPLDEELNDLALLGLEVDLTSSKPIRMSEQPDDGIPDLPPSPILYAYTNDGTVVAWHILNNSGEAYPGMNSNGAANLVPDPQITQQKEGTQTFGMSSPRISPVSQETVSVFNQASTTSTPPPTSAFGQTAPSASTAPAAGFGAFANINSSTKFGSTGFGVGSGSIAQKPGGSSTTPAFGSTGFGGASASQTTPQAPTTPAFGTTGFGQASAAPAFGVSSFGSKPAAPAFGQTSFGATPLGAAKPASTFGSISGGFASFATQGSSAFGAPLSSVSKSASPPPSAFGQESFSRTNAPFTPTSAFGTGGQGQASPPASAFGSGGVGQASNATTPSTTAFGQQAPKSQSAFGGFNQTGGGSKPTTPPITASGQQEQSRSAFGSFGQSGAGSGLSQKGSSQQDNGAFGGFGGLGDALKSNPTRKLDSPPGSPPSPSGSLPESPELGPSSLPMKSTSSYLRPAEGFGALKQPQKPGSSGGTEKPYSSFIKPAGGFGAISQPKAQTPALQQKPATSPVAATTPTFGSTSTLGPAKPVFGSSSFGTAPQQRAVEPTKPITGGFSAFSSSGGGFASFANAGKPTSFADMLGSSELGKPKPDTPPALGSMSSDKPSNVPVFGVPADQKVSTTPAGKSADMSKTRTVKTNKHDSDEEKEKEDGGDKFPEEKLANQEPSLSTKEFDPSFGHTTFGESLSQTAASSTPRPDASSQQAEGGSAAKTGEENDEGPEEGEETSSETFSLTEESESDDDELPRSPTRSPSEEEESTHTTSSTTHHDEISRSTPISRSEDTAKISAAKPASQVSKPMHLTPDVGESSTTPPGSPEKPEMTSQNASPSPAAPTPIVPVSATSPFGLGLGRPSSRPMRSSPLASAPITSGDEESIPRSSSKSAPPTSKVTPSEPKATTGQFLQPASAPSTPPTTAGGGPLSSKPRRPKTPPPLLSTSSSIAGAMRPPSGSSVALGPPRISPTTMKPPRSTPVIPPTENEAPHHPMQIEFLRAHQDMSNELVQLYAKYQETEMVRPIISKPRGLDKLVADNQEFIPGRYSQGDLKAFATMINILQKRVVPLLEQGNVNKRSLRELQNLALISETKLEEVARWVRARQDPDFAKALNSRTLGPEHSENQIRLRKAVQMVRDRIQQCEDEIESLKKRLDQHKSGKVGLRPPSLDTIDRTCRNIQLALDERIKLLNQLRDRIETLSPKVSQRLQTSPNLRQSPVRNLSSVTPPFASVAAAALNSERSSLKLKTALLYARKEPVLTIQITKLESSKAAGPDTRLASQFQRPEWKLPPVPPLGSSTSSQGMSSMVRRTGGTGNSKRNPAVQLKGNTSEPNSKTVAFDWGPLPSAAPMDKLSADVRNSRGRTGHLKQETGDDS